MAKRKKRLIKQEKGLLKQMQKHLQKLEKEQGRKDTTHKYWKGEIIRFEQMARARARMFENLVKKKKSKK